ncbi:MAG: 4Fe-4S binding protein [Acidobacteria bacterium]|nr:MAG: 4Fe-4S binding protein [Acidobacteriota bacterium]
MGEKARGRLTITLILAAAVLLPAFLARFLTPPPRTRDIHIEAFRYGFSPERIEVNRGDRLRLTFSTRDTGQSLFLQDYDLHVVMSPGSKLVEVYRLSHPDDPPVRMRVVELTAGLPGWTGHLVSKSQFRNHTYNGPMHGTERGELIVSPNYLLAAGIGLAVGIAVISLLLQGRRRTREAEARVNLFAPLQWLKRIVKKPTLQFALTLPMLAVFYFVILAGLLGTKVSGRNAGPMVIWVLWLSALIILLVPLGGRIWCLVCPLPSLGEWLQRRRMAGAGSQPSAPSLPLNRGANAWPRTIFFLLLGTFSMALVAVPAATSWLLLGLVGLAVVTSLAREQRIFCRFLCPINSFISLYAMTGRLMIRSASPSTCANCRERFCLSGSLKGWGCPYGLCVGELDRNNDCGMCTECVKTCAYDNVALFWRTSGWDRSIRSQGEAWQAMVMFGLAAVYGIINLGPWHRIRGWIDIVDKQNWGTFWVYAAVVWGLLLVIVPGLLYLLTKAGLYLETSGRGSSEAVPVSSMFRACSAALVPLGASLWIAFAIGVFCSMLTFVLQSLSDPFNWGWNLLGMAGSPWHILWAPAIPWLQVSCVLIGLVYSLKTLGLCWRDNAANGQSGLLGPLPLAAFLWFAALGMASFYAG